jgi:mono/diheme cytochrome c family protein/DNA-binding beta-propeller fold protein YncE
LQVPPLSGGTLVVSGNEAIASLPEHDRVVRVDLDAGTVLSSTALEAGDEPGRIALDAQGRIHVVLRGAGAIATIDPAQPERAVARRTVCAEPRGLAYDPVDDVLFVVCRSGELVTLPSGGGDALRRVSLDDDLRDVIVDGPVLRISRFRAAELLTVDREGHVVSRERPPVLEQRPATEGLLAEPAVAWRTIGLAGGGVAMLHQRASMMPVPTDSPGGYGRSDEDEGCGPVVESAVTMLGNAGGGRRTPRLGGQSGPGTLGVDAAVSPDGQEVAVALAGNQGVVRQPLTATVMEGFECSFAGGPLEATPGMPVAVAYDAEGRVVVQTRGPARIGRLGAPLVGIDLEDTIDAGFELFHASTPSAVACASCHPEGTEDGRTWRFDFGPRRTQTVSGGLLATAPFHWDGAMRTFDTLLEGVLVDRMGADAATPEQSTALASWLDGLPALRPGPTTDADAVARGRALFESHEVGCASCHSCALFTNNRSADVGTGQRFQVPSLLAISTRAPFLHDGCAPTLRDPFGPCGGARHGNVSGLSEPQLDDLVAYLHSL